MELTYKTKQTVNIPIENVLESLERDLIKSFGISDRAQIRDGWWWVMDRVTYDDYDFVKNRKLNDKELVLLNSLQNIKEHFKT